ncbi:hypothetical protein NPIL_467341 [Nephila pilipes]|uniref:Uncharacterized protein n=1 Tax=Nephila pilipes TaxID=299642 RepID=A0A8X6UDP2_NEPPI|nr:hypothetical protein NPIL_467341 [Nephila pilipes]
MDRKDESREEKTKKDRIDPKNKRKEKPKSLEVPKVTLSKKFVFEDRTTLNKESVAVHQAKQLISDVIEKGTSDHEVKRASRSFSEKVKKRAAAADKANRLISKVSQRNVANDKVEGSKRTTETTAESDDSVDVHDVAIVNKVLQLLSAGSQKDISISQQIEKDGVEVTKDETVRIESGESRDKYTEFMHTLKIEDLENGKRYFNLSSSSYLSIAD